MCANKGNTDDGFHCGGFITPSHSCPGTDLWHDSASCINFFRTMWSDQMAWLEDGLSKSTADWQFIVTHFPANYPTLHELNPLYEKYGVDLVMSGHSHLQQ